MSRSNEVECEVVETEMENDEGRLVPAVHATCSQCGHETSSYGTHDGSIRRCLALMREECPNDERNFYVQG